MRASSSFALVAALACAAGSVVANAADAAPPARVVTLPTEHVGSDTPGAETATAARHEAAAAWAESQRACRREADRDARRDCLAAARADHDRLLAQAQARR